MDVGRLTQGQKIAGAAGLLLLISLWLGWYGVDLGPAAAAVGVSIDVTANAWEAFGMIDLLLFLTALAAIALAVLTATGRTADLPVNPAQVAAGLGALSTLLVLYRIINPPGEGGIGVEFGAFIGLLAAAGVAFGAWRAMQEAPAAIAAPAAATPAPAPAAPAPAASPEPPAGSPGPPTV